MSLVNTHVDIVIKIELPVELNYFMSGLYGKTSKLNGSLNDGECKKKWVKFFSPCFSYKLKCMTKFTIWNVGELSGNILDPLNICF